MDLDGTIRASAKIGLQILVLASEWPSQDVPIGFDQAINVADLKDTGDIRYKGELGRWTAMINSVFERLVDQKLITGLINEANQRLSVCVAAEVTAKLNEATRGNEPRIETIRTALLTARGQAPDALGPFVDLAREIGFEP